MKALSLLRRLRGSEFALNVATLATGTSFAQLIPFLAAPVLTRLYSPIDFGVFALFFAIVSVVGIAATGRYVHAILLPEDDRDAEAVLWLSMGLALITAFFALGVAWAVQPLLPPRFRLSGIGLALLPVSVLLVAVLDAFYSWVNRRRSFGIMGRSKILQWGSATAVQLTLGWLLVGGSTGLIVGFVGGQALAGLYLMGHSVRSGDLGLRSVAGRRSGLARRYRDFPRFALPAGLANAVTNQLPVLFMAAFGQASVGLYNLTQRVLAAPTSLVGRAVLDVFRERAARDYTQNGTCRPLYVKTLKALSLLAIGPALLLALLAPWLFALIFGEEWRTAGEYARIMAPLFLLQFVVSPLSYVLLIAEKQRYDLVWQLTLLGATAAALTAGVQLGSARATVALFTLAYCTMYAVYLWMSYHFSRDSKVVASRNPTTPEREPMMNVIIDRGVGNVDSVRKNPWVADDRR